MANYHFTTKNRARRGGKSCVASLAYRSATKLEDQQTGEVFNYVDKAFVRHVEILIPENSPSWICDIVEECKVSRETALQKLSNIFEVAEKRHDARVYREIEFSLPNELTAEQNIEWANNFIRDNCVKLGMVAIANFHFDIDEEGAKPHCHVLLSTRALTDKGLSSHKQREWNRVELLQEWREQYAHYQNAALKAHGFDVRVDHRSYKERGLMDIEAQPKRGRAVIQMTAKGFDADKQAIFDLVRLKNQFKILQNPELVFAIVTANHSTFTGKDIAKVLHRYIDDVGEFQRLYQRLINSQELIRLDSYKNEVVYTTRELLRTEMDLVQTAETLASQESHSIDEKLIENAITRQDENLVEYGGLSVDQKAAIRHMLASNQLSCVIGYAGAGKTTALEAASEAWKNAGYKVVGLAPTGRAVETLSCCGIRAMTLHKFLYAQRDGREQLSQKSVLVIDEAGMVDSRRFSELLTLVERSGAKLVTIGDGNQLQAIEAGPAFRLLTSRIQPAVLETVIRQQEEWQREATRLFGTLETRKALELYQEKGTFNIFERHEAAQQALVKAWTRDFLDKPNEAHLMLAFSNSDVINLNEKARIFMREQGNITGSDFIYTTKRIDKDDFDREVILTQQKSFAKGDRLLFTRNDNGLGVKNGSLGTIQTLNKRKIAVVLDGSGKIISFAPKLYPFIDNGWATTIHKAQGVTVDHVKKLISRGEYRNLAYVSMSRHRKSLTIFASTNKVMQYLSRIQEKLSGLDYLNPDQVHKQLRIDAKILWHAKKLQQGRDLWRAVKVTTHDALNQLLSRPKEDTPYPTPQTFETNEEKRSEILFGFKERLPTERAKFEEAHKGKYREACEFFEFRACYGHAPTPEDLPLVYLMSEQLTCLAGRIFQERALKEGKLPNLSEVTKQAYQEFAQRPVVEKALAERLTIEYRTDTQTAQTIASLMLTQQDITGHEPTNRDEALALKVAEFSAQRVREISVSHNESLKIFRLAQELKQIQAHVVKHGLMPTPEKLKEIRERATFEAQGLEIKVQRQQIARMQKEQALKQQLK